MEQNVYEKLFDELLRWYDMTLVRYGKNAYRVFSSYYCIDDQTVCQTLDDLYATISATCADGIVEDLENEARDYGLNDFVAHPWDEALACIAKYNAEDASRQEQQYVKNHKWEIEVLDMLCNHLDEIDINHLDAEDSEECQVFYVEIHEVRHKLVRVIADTPADAFEKATQAKEYGNIECDEVSDKYIEPELFDKQFIEEYYEDVTEIELINEEGEVE